MNEETKVWNTESEWSEVTSGPVIKISTPLLFQPLKNGFFPVCASLLFWVRTEEIIRQRPKKPQGNVFLKTVNGHC